jgi:hypothetical protein
VFLEEGQARSREITPSALNLSLSSAAVFRTRKLSAAHKLSLLHHQCLFQSLQANTVLTSESSPSIKMY